MPTDQMKYSLSVFRMASDGSLLLYNVTTRKTWPPAVQYTVQFIFNFIKDLTNLGMRKRVFYKTDVDLKLPPPRCHGYR